MPDLVCVSREDADQFGCPCCGRHDTFVLLDAGATRRLCCRGCENNFVTLADGVDQSSFSITVGPEQIFPRVQRHPLRRSRKTLRVM
ncbi:MAG: hypothetical protein CMI52_04250 [Parcubacteria group bacterium]|nr:hypothetical protein [Parcubacteria group bacterium]